LSEGDFVIEIGFEILGGGFLVFRKEAHQQIPSTGFAFDAVIY